MPKSIESKNGNQNQFSTAPATSKMSFLGGIARFMGQLFTSSILFWNFFSQAKSPETQSSISSLKDRVSFPDKISHEDLLPFHKEIAAEISQHVKSNSEVDNFCADKKFVEMLDQMPGEIRKAFQSYLRKRGMFEAKPIATKGFFAALSAQTQIREIVKQAKDDSFAETEYQEVPEATKEAYRVFLREKTDQKHNPANLRPFFSMLVIPEIKLSGDEVDLLALKMLRKQFESKEDVPSSIKYGELGSFNSTQLPVNLLITINEILHKSTDAEEKREKCLKLFDNHIKRISKQIKDTFLSSL